MIHLASLAQALTDVTTGVINAARPHRPPANPPVIPSPRRPVDHALPDWHPSPDVLEELSDPFLHALLLLWAGESA